MLPLQYIQDIVLSRSACYTFEEIDMKSHKHSGNSVEAAIAGKAVDNH